MNQQMNQASVDPPVKRKRGRPRKDESQAQAIDRSPAALSKPPLRPMVTRLMQGEGSSATTNTTNMMTSKGKDQMEVNVEQAVDEEHNNDEMVGKVVIGVLECAFDAGYFLRVRVGDSNVHMRGVVFKEDCIVPVTPENDIAPNAKMYKRMDIPIPMTLSPQVAPQPTVSVEDQQKQPPPVEASPREEAQQIVHQGGQTVEQQQEQEKLTVEKEPSLVVVDQEQNAAPKEDLILGEGNDQEKATEISEPTDNTDNAVIPEAEANASTQLEDKMVENSSPKVVNELENEQGSTTTKEGLNESSEPIMKLPENSEQGASESETAVVKADEETATEPTVLPEEAIAPVPEDAAVAKETEVMPDVVPTVAELEPECGVSGFQISMENTDNDEPEPEPEPMPEAPSEVGPMETE